MSNFTQKSNWYKQISKYKYITTQELSWEIGTLGSGLLLIVPKNFQFDISVPKYLQWALSPNNPKVLKAAALHDYALDLGWDRVSAAAVFHGGLTSQKINKWYRLLLTISVLVWHWK